MANTKYTSRNFYTDVMNGNITEQVKEYARESIKKMDEKRQVFIMRCLIVVFIAISVVLAIIQYKSSVTFIAQLMGVSWGALAGAFLAPFQSFFFFFVT